MDSLSFLLLDETRGFKAAESAVAEMAMQLLYVPCEGEVLSSSGSPGFSLYLEMLQLLSEVSALPDDQRFAGDLMAKNLNSFLSTSAGKIFMSNENFSINSGIFGVNFSKGFGDMLAQPAGLGGARHGVPLIPDTARVQDQWIILVRLFQLTTWRHSQHSGTPVRRKETTLGKKAGVGTITANRPLYRRKMIIFGFVQCRNVT